ncbi:hypothetical protein F070042J6_16140 [Bacteroides sp. f07]|uniref:glycosyltransferase family 2 protein n=1 Tax=Bacteroides sp. f07 TaxID=3132704 RepID=UPI0034B97BDA
MDRPKISVIIPVYNRENTITACVSSIIQSEYKNLEIIIVDDGSVDNSLKICEELASKDSRISVIPQNNAGVSAARNNGLGNATGDWVTFVDSDDGIHPSCYSTLYDGGYLEAYDLLMFGRGFSRFRDGKVLLKHYPDGDKVDLESRDKIIDYLFNRFDPYSHDFFFVHDKLFRKSILDEHKIMFQEDVTLGEDQIFVLDYLHHVNRFYYTGAAYALNFIWTKYEKQIGLGGALRKPEYFIFIQKRNYEAFERLLAICNNEGLKKYEVNYIIDRPITRVLYRYLLLSNMSKYPYKSLKNFTQNSIMPLFNLELTNLSMVRDSKTKKYVMDLFEKPFWKTYITIAIEQNTLYYIGMLKRFVKMPLRKIKRILTDIL